MCFSMRRKAKDKFTIKIDQEEIKEVSEIKTQTDLKTLNEKLKQWLKQNQTCDH